MDEREGAVSRAILLLSLMAMTAVEGCVERNVRLYVSVNDKCAQYCEGLLFKVIYDGVEEGTFSAGEQVLIEKPIGDNGKLTVTVHNDSGANNHPLKCQKYISSKINIQEWTPTPEDEVYVYYNQLIYFQNQDLDVEITCAPLPQITEGACDGVSCWAPPENTCVENNVISMVEPKGVCAEGECIYPSRLDLCAQGWCYDSRCESSLPCEGVYCLSPPSNECAAGNILFEYSPFGVCDNGECIYEGPEVSCASGACASGVCLDTPCEGIRCDKPPANACVDGETLRSYSATGRCTLSGGVPTCTYTAQYTPCAYGCTEGSCIVYPCVDVTCNTPPANYCDRDDLIAFSDVGYCSKGACRYLSQRVYCGGQCTEGKCRDTDPCVGMICNDPPTPFCVNNNTLRTYSAAGSCADGLCAYTIADIPCGGDCTNGMCESDQCLGAVCNTPPADYCIDDNAAMQFSDTGRCEGAAMCIYNAAPTVCPDGCYEGWCP
jgi:hypothetical protein